MSADSSSAVLADICVDVSYGYTASASSAPVGPKFLRITDIQGGVVDWKDVPFCEANESAKRKNALQYGDIVIARTGNSTGENYFFDSDEEAVFASYLIRFRVDPELANPYFVWLQLRTQDWWNYVAGSKSGSAQAGANAKVLGQFEINLPDRATQDQVEQIIRGMNEKLRVNSEINQNLEQMAQAIFKSWFVDFEPVKAKTAALEEGGTEEDALLAAMQVISGKDAGQLTQMQAEQPEQYTELRGTAELFPSAMQDSELGEIPEGWEACSAQSKYQITIGKTPPRKEPEWFTTSPQDMKWLSIKKMGDGNVFVNDTDEYLTPEAIRKHNIKLCPVGTVLLSFKLTLGRVAIANAEMATNEAIAHFRIGADSPGAYWTYLYLSAFDYDTLGSTSSIATAVNSKTIKGMSLVVASEPVLQRFEAVVKPIFECIRNGQLNNESLVSLRDTLLPKLLSGELTLPDTEAAQAESQDVANATV